MTTAIQRKKVEGLGRIIVLLLRFDADSLGRLADELEKEISEQTTSLRLVEELAPAAT